MRDPSVARRVKRHRDSLKAERLRPAQIQVPDTRAPGFAGEGGHQTALAAASDRADPKPTGFVDAALDDLGTWE